MGFGEDSLHIKLVDLAAIDLIECDLKFTSNVVVVKAEIILFCQQDVLVLRLIVFDRDRTGWSTCQSLTHFIGEFEGCHRRLRLGDVDDSRATQTIIPPRCRGDYAGVTEQTPAEMPRLYRLRQRTTVNGRVQKESFAAQ
jgi:hypothetical protein